MEKLITLPDDWEEMIKNVDKSRLADALVDIIRLGDVLPKKHGRLIDGDALELLCLDHKITNNYMNDGTPIISIGRDENGERIWESLFEQAPTIIEASKG